MEFFTEIPDSHVLLYQGGVFKQTALAVRGKRLFAKHGGGYIRLSPNNTTSVPKVRWDEIDIGEGSYERVGLELNYVAPTLAAPEKPKRIAKQ